MRAGLAIFLFAFFWKGEGCVSVKMERREGRKRLRKSGGIRDLKEKEEEGEESV